MGKEALQEGRGRFRCQQTFTIIRIIYRIRTISKFFDEEPKELIVEVCKCRINMHHTIIPGIWTQCQVSEAITRDDFKHLFVNFHVCNNQKLCQSEIFIKVRRF